MKKKGFTLIELLAVIVILAIIALIATPLVLKYIEYSKEKSAKLSANTYAEAVEKEYVSKLTSNEKIPNKEYTIKELDELGVKVKGDKPEGENDYVTLRNGNVVEYKLTIKGYIITYEDGKTTVESEKDSDSSNEGLLDHTVKFIVDGEPYQIISVKDGDAVNYPIDSSGNQIIPVGANGSFYAWVNDNEEKITFPYIPTKDEEINAKFQTVREEMEFTEAGEVYWRHTDGYTQTKQNADKAIGGIVKDGTSTTNVRFVLVSTTDEGTLMDCSMGNNSTESGTVIYEGVTYYYRYSTRIGQSLSTYTAYYSPKLYNTEVSSDDMQTAITKLLDYYFMKSS